MTRQVPIIRCRQGERQQQVDVVADEEALAIEVNSESLTLTMRTPGDDSALALGLLYSEGIIRSREDVATICFERDDAGDEDTTKLLVTLQNSAAPLPRTGWERRFPSTSSCGVCGKTDHTSMQCIAVPLAAMEPQVSCQTIYTLNDRMRNAQKEFDATGGLHAAALFAEDGELIVLKEDIGRHNAVDKVIGSQLQADQMPLRSRILMTSGRASFEIVQKAAVAQIPILCSVSAPSSLAVRLAHDMNMTLIGFLRGEGMNIYTCPLRVCEP